MKARLTTMLIVVVAAMMEVVAQTPSGLAVLFDGPYHDNPLATETVITGDPLAPYSLSRFHSLEVADDPELALPLESAVRADGAKSLWKETVSRKGRLESGVYELPGKGKRRYILYLNRFITGGNNATVIYLEGNADPKKIKKLINAISD